MKDLHKLDPLDRLLVRLPSEDVPEDLNERVLGYVRGRRRRRSAARLFLSLALAALGFYLSSPLVVEIPDTSKMPDSGLSMTWTWIEVGVSDLRLFLTSAWEGISRLQSGTAAPLSASICLGLAILAVSALLAASPLLQRNTGALRKGV